MTAQTAAQRIFGAQAPLYAVSKVHIRDDSLDEVERLAAVGAPHRWAVDIGTGTGFTAFAMTALSERVLASDITNPMLQQAKRLGSDRRLKNLALTQNSAEALPFADSSLDLITCRKAAHHFSGFERALDEMRRTIRTGGSLVMADSVSPEDDALFEWINSMESRRDFSHVSDRKASVIRRMLADRGFKVTGSENARVYLEFNDWVARTKVEAQEVDALRRDFQSAGPEVQAAFQVQPTDEAGDFMFSWPTWVFRAVKG